MQKFGTTSHLMQSRFVGRELEFEEIKGHLAESINGHGRLVFITGEAGIGKTRLITELKEYANTQNVLSLMGQCLYHENADPYLPFIDAFGDFIIDRHSAANPKNKDNPTSEDFFSMGLVGIS